MKLKWGSSTLVYSIDQCLPRDVLMVVGVFDTIILTLDVAVSHA